MKRGRKCNRKCDEPESIECRDGSLWMLVRTLYGIGRSFFRDGGKSWTEVEPSGIENPVNVPVEFKK